MSVKAGGRDVAIVGTGTTGFVREFPGRSIWDLSLHAIMNAIADAGIKQKNEIDGIIVTPTGRYRDGRVGYSMGEHLGIFVRPLSTHNEGGSGATGLALDMASWALQEGRVKYVVLVDAGKWTTEPRYAGAASFLDWQFDQDNGAGLLQASWPMHRDEKPTWGGNFLTDQALIACRHMHEFGTTETALAGVAVAARHNASLNAEAVYRKPTTVSAVLAEPMIATPLRRSMCSMVNEGASAVVLTTAARARYLHERPVFILGSGSGFMGQTLIRHAALDPGRYDMVRSIGRLAAATAFQVAGVEPSDIDVAEWSDPSAIATIMALEDYGFCKKGEGGGFVGDGSAIKVGGRLPINTHGGWLSGTFASGSHATLVEAVRQLRGEAAQHQVKNAELAFFASSGGAFSTHSVAVLTNRS